MATYAQVFSIRRLWILLALSMVVMFATLLYFGREIYRAAPPIPEAVVTESGRTLFTRADIERGQGVWQAMGGMQQGSIWGHGGYLAPDWSADWLHREALAYLDLIAQSEEGAPFAELDERRQEYARVALRLDMRANTYDPATGAITVSDGRASAIAHVGEHYRDLYQGRTEEALHLREQYA
ncbi:MAG TPA: nitric-oxide reductase large subunit, partial [Terricaulis sp.]|nr:nitric-oxide reductase large subunit [Terricaulis sp.]